MAVKQNRIDTIDVMRVFGKRRPSTVLSSVPI
jgi:hypothetical protein